MMKWLWKSFPWIIAGDACLFVISYVISGMSPLTERLGHVAGGLIVLAFILGFAESGNDDVV